MKHRKIYIENIGCYRRSLDASWLKEYFLLNDCSVVKSAKKADYIVVFTCGVGAAYEDAAINRIDEIRRKKYKAKLIVTGCLPTINKPKLDQVHDGPTVPIRKLNEIDKMFPDFGVKLENVPDANTYTTFAYAAHAPAIWRAFAYNSWSNYRKLVYCFTKKYTTPYNIRVSWGCLGRCSYCGIRKAIGKMKSKPLNQCLSELDKGVTKGIRLFNLVSDDIGAYGLDIGTDFSTLIDTMLTQHPDVSVLVNDLHPQWLIKYEEKLLPHLKSGGIDEMWCTVQSGSDRILKLMARPGNSDLIRETLVRIKKASPASRINTNLICGFPTETDEEWEQSLNLVKESKFDLVLLFPYQRINGTEAAAMSGHLDRKIIRERVNYAQHFFKMYNVTVLFIDMSGEYGNKSKFHKGVENIMMKSAQKLLDGLTSSNKFRACVSRRIRQIFSRKSA